ncbi:MAG: serine/threonine protein kinase [Planctomycetes bacterium]|nr:serine/threonine protein kinase [Planctomycetota bacterium]
MIDAVDSSARASGAAPAPQGGGPAAALSPGLPRIAGFRLERLLGQGGMGMVYLAWEEALERWVALKVLPPRFVDEPEALERFRREARALAQIDHPNIVQIHAIGEPDGLPFFSMAYVEGEPLGDALRAAAAGAESRFAHFFRRRHSNDRRPDLAAALVAQAVAGALADLHAVGIVHRDIKPGNIIIDARGRPMLVDFGVACDPNATRLTTEAASPGTLRFMPPEQLNAAGAAAVDVRSDVYSLGVTLFETLTLRPAFPQDEIGALIDAIRQGRMEGPRAVDPAVPRALDEIVRCAAARRPDDRFQSAADLLAALRAATCALADPGSLSGTALTQELDRAIEKRGRSSERGFFKRRLGARAGALDPGRRRRRRRACAAAACVLGAGIAYAAFLGLGRFGPESGSVAARDVPRPDASATPDPPSAALPAPAGDALIRPGVRARMAADALARLREFAASGERTPLLEAAEALLAGDPAQARRILSSVREPGEPRARAIYWQLLLEVGDSRERQIALEMLAAAGAAPVARRPDPKRTAGDLRMGSRPPP